MFLEVMVKKAEWNWLDARLASLSALSAELGYPISWKSVQAGGYREYTLIGMTPGNPDIETVIGLMKIDSELPNYFMSVSAGPVSLYPEPICIHGCATLGNNKLFLVSKGAKRYWKCTSHSGPFVGEGESPIKFNIAIELLAEARAACLIAEDSTTQYVRVMDFFPTDCAEIVTYFERLPATLDSTVARIKELIGCGVPKFHTSQSSVVANAERIYRAALKAAFEAMPWFEKPAAPAVTKPVTPVVLKPATPVVEQPIGWYGSNGAKVTLEASVTGSKSYSVGTGLNYLYFLKVKPSGQVLKMFRTSKVHAQDV